MLMRVLVLWCLVTLAACSNDAVPIVKRNPDQCLRRELFNECLKALPSGPLSTATSNDWDEVVDACREHAYYTSIRNVEQIKPECR